MIKAALEYIMQLKAPVTINHDGREYSTINIHPIKEPTQTALTIGTLTGIVDYFNTDPDDFHKNNSIRSMIVHVKAHNKVSVVSATHGDWIQRHALIDASISHQSYPFGQYLPMEDFMISLQTYFVQTETMEKLQAVAGNLVETAEITITDDGVTQQTAAKSGIARVSTIQLPNPINLAPYRTFRELDQPESKFIFRLKKSPNGMTAALFEADGGNWQQKCTELIRAWLITQLPDGAIILE